MIGAIFFLLIAFVFICIIFKHKSSKHVLKALKNKKSALIVTAHPDDECMFFAPTILNLKKVNINMHILCLSNGNFYGNGKLRERELMNSAEYLGVPFEQCHIIDSPRLQDDPNANWKKEDIIECVLDFIDNNCIDILITFDNHGVSHHSNHISIYKAVNWLQKNNRLSDIAIFYLETVMIFRKYSSVFDIIFSFLSLSENDILTLVSVSEFFQGFRAMASHRSQLMWFRILYMFFSRYMFINSLKKCI